MKPVWHEKFREQAEQRFQSTPLPTGKSENFRFTSLAEVPELLSRGSSLSSRTVPSFLCEKSDDEIFLALHGNQATGERFFGKDFHFSDLEAALATDEALLKPVFSAETNSSGDKFTLFAKARWVNGAFLKVSKNVKLDKPFRISHWLSGDQGVYAFRSVFMLEEGASATIVEEFLGEATHSGMISGLIEAHLAPGAHLHYVQVQNLGENSEFFIRQEFYCKENARAKIVPIYVGGKKGQLRHDSQLLGAGAHVDLRGAARGSHDQHFDFWLNSIHPQKHTSSNLDFWFVMGDRARAVFNGLLDIKTTGLHTEAYQKSRSLLLSSEATVHSIPKLLIATDQVQCSHGASVSTLNPEQVYYLQSRGLSRVQAERMIIQGFTQPVLDEIPISAVFQRTDKKFSKVEELLS